RLTVPGHASAEHFINVGNRPRTGFWHSAADHHAVGVEAVHMDIALNPALEVDAILFNLRPRFLEPGASEVGEIVPIGDPNAPASASGGAFVITPPPGPGPSHSRSRPAAPG